MIFFIRFQIHVRKRSYIGRVRDLLDTAAKFPKNQQCLGQQRCSNSDASDSADSALALSETMPELRKKCASAASNTR
jgi:hypothetical protein